MSFTELKIKEEDFKGRNIQSIGTDIVIGKSEELKRLFDAPAQEVLKEKINVLIDYLTSADAAKEIGAPELNEASGNTVAEQISYLFREMQSIYAGGIIDGSIDDAKLSNDRGQIKQSVAKHKNMMEELELAPHNAIISWTSFVPEGGQMEDATNRFNYIEPQTGALHLENTDDNPKYGLLPITCGGTGADNSVSAKSNLGLCKKIWSGSWNNGSITVPDWQDYNLFLIVIDGAASPILISRYGNALRGIGGNITETGIWTMCASITVNSDQTWKYSFAGYLGHTGNSAHNAIVNNSTILGIWGIV